ncbi:nucleotidyltransferase family protein [Gymnodinialimonas sp.]
MRDTTRFVAACCRWPIDADAREAVRHAAEGVADWDEVRDAVMRHRVVALVHGAVRGQSNVPEAFCEWVSGMAKAQTLHALQLTQECIAVDKTLVAAGITPVHIKGPVLGQIAFGSVARKFSRDLDVLVVEAEAVQAIFALQEKGYRRSGDGLPFTQKQARAVIRYCKDLSLIGPSGTLVELHWRLTNTKALLNGIESRLERQTVTVVGATEMQTMGDEQTVLYLCVHGSSHHWMRLKWLAELAAFLHQLGPERRARILEAVATTPERNSVTAALKLCDTFLGTDYAPEMSPRAQALYRYSVGRIDRPLVEPKRFWGDLRFIFDMLEMRHLYASPWTGIWALKAHLICQEDVVAWPLPASLSGVYVLIRGPSYLVRRLRALLSRRGQSLKPQV